VASDARLEVVDVDTLVIGGGVAGYSAALAASARGKVLVLAKDTMRESNSDYAQGGVAAVLGEEDSISAHVEDTLTVGAGLCEPEAVKVVVEEGPRRVRELITSGADASIPRRGVCSSPSRAGIPSVGSCMRRTRPGPRSSGRSSPVFAAILRSPFGSSGSPSTSRSTMLAARAPTS
jgi:hypothetical protein